MFQSEKYWVTSAFLTIESITQLSMLSHIFLSGSLLSHLMYYSNSWLVLVYFIYSPLFTLFHPVNFSQCYLSYIFYILNRNALDWQPKYFTTFHIIIFKFEHHLHSDWHTHTSTSVHTQLPLPCTIHNTITSFSHNWVTPTISLFLL